MTASEHVPGGMVDRAELVDRQAVRSASSSVTGMVLLVASEAVFFAAFLGIYAGVLHGRARCGRPGDRNPVDHGPDHRGRGAAGQRGAMALAMRHALRREYQRSALLGWLTAALVFAVAFGVLTAIGYASLPFSVSQGIYESLFYMIIGLELAHVVGGRCCSPW